MCKHWDLGCITDTYMNKWYLYQYIYISASIELIIYFLNSYGLKLSMTWTVKYNLKNICTFEKNMNHKNFFKKKMNSNKHKLRHACLLFHVI
jgi:hypothetical protein